MFHPEKPVLFNVRRIMKFIIVFVTFLGAIVLAPVFVPTGFSMSWGTIAELGIVVFMLHFFPIVMLSQNCDCSKKKAAQDKATILNILCSFFLIIELALGLWAGTAFWAPIPVWWALAISAVMQLIVIALVQEVLWMRRMKALLPKKRGLKSLLPQKA